MSGSFRLAPALLAIALLAGCSHAIKFPLPAFDSAPPPSRAAAIGRLAAATPCCHAWADLPYHIKLPESPREFTLDKFSPVAVLDDAPTHFITFRLPKFQQPYRVVFQTRPSARHLGNSYLLAPTATLLNADRKPMSSTDVTLCVYIDWRPGMSGAFGAISVDNPNARYLVVTTSSQQLAGTTYWAQSPVTFNNVHISAGSALGGIRAATPVSRGIFDVPHGPEGTLTVGRMTPAYAGAVDNGLCGRPSTGNGVLPRLRRARQNP